MKKIHIQAPGTIANLVCGFDIMGLCLEAPFDEMSLELTEVAGLEIIHADKFDLPVDPEKNVAGVVVLSMLQQLRYTGGIKMVINKKIKPGSGIGSSAASAAGAAVGVNELFDRPFTKGQLVQFAMKGEELASGVQHADNIAPCIYGGICLVRSSDPLHIVPLPYPDLYLSIVHPQIEIRTADARGVLKKEVSLQTAVVQWGNIAGLVAGLCTKNYGLIGSSLYDSIIEPLRGMLIPGFKEIKEAGKLAGALGGGISGSGPSLFMVSSNVETAQRVCNGMEEVYQELGISYHVHLSKINKDGVRISTVPQLQIR